MKNNILYEKAISLVKEQELITQYSHYKEELINNDFTIANLK